MRAVSIASVPRAVQGDADHLPDLARDQHATLAAFHLYQSMGAPYGPWDQLTRGQRGVFTVAIGIATSSVRVR